MNRDGRTGLNRKRTTTSPENTARKGELVNKAARKLEIEFEASI
jgi:hypothetical protein